jgi:hypothetical protein
MGVGNGTHTLTAIAGTKLHGNTRDDVTFVAKGIPAQNNSANSGGGNVITQSKVGTLNASTQGYMYLTGPRNGYLGYKQRVINLYPGTYYIYVYGPTTYKLCNKIKIVINAGKTTLVRYSGGTCR